MAQNPRRPHRHLASKHSIQPEAQRALGEAGEGGYSPTRGGPQICLGAPCPLVPRGQDHTHRGQSSDLAPPGQHCFLSTDPAESSGLLQMRGKAWPPSLPDSVLEIERFVRWDQSWRCSLNPDNQQGVLPVFFVQRAWGEPLLGLGLGQRDDTTGWPPSEWKRRAKTVEEVRTL